MQGNSYGKKERCKTFGLETWGTMNTFEFCRVNKSFAYYHNNFHNFGHNSFMLQVVSGEKTNVSL